MSNPLEGSILRKSCSGTQLNEMAPPAPLNTTTPSESKPEVVKNTPTVKSDDDDDRAISSVKQNTRAFLSSTGLDMGAGMSYLASFTILAITTTVFGLASLFLETYVLNANAAIVVFVVGSYVVWSSYHSFHFYLMKCSKSYASIDDQPKQFYVLSNLIKSAVLLSYSPLAAVLLYETMVHDTWDSNRIRIMGTLYCIPDFVSLFMVSRMATTTMVHHIVVCVFNAFSLYNDYDQINVIRAIMVYAVWSTFAYMVNLLLASRFVDTSPTMSMVLSALALIIYGLCCLFNWSWQVWFLSGLFQEKPFQVIGYVALMGMLVWDDIVLMKWLFKNVVKKAKGMADDAAENAQKASQPDQPLGKRMNGKEE